MPEVHGAIAQRCGHRVGGVGAVVHSWPQFPFVNLLALGPAALTALWVLHIFTYGGRVVTAQRHTEQEAQPATGSVMTRRRMATVFAAGVGFAAVASALIPLRALANNGNGCGSTGCGYYKNPNPSACCPGWN